MTETAAATIRPATAADAPELGRLGAQLVAVHHAYDPARFLAPTPQTEQGYGAFLASQVARDDVILLVAVQESGAVVGYCYAGLEGTDWVTLRGPAGLIHDVLVSPTLRGQGIGSRLLDAMLAALKARDVPQVVLSTAEPNQAARRLFATKGFRPTMVEMTYDPSGG